VLQCVAASSVLQCIAVCCSVLQCVAVCCSVLQCVAASDVLQCVAVCCGVLQCVAVCCRVLQLHLRNSSRVRSQLRAPYSVPPNAPVLDESCHTCQGAMSHIWMSHVTRVNMSCH